MEYAAVAPRVMTFAFALARMLCGLAARVVREWVTPSAVFLVVAAVAGAVLVFLIPPYQTADENAHYYRAYQVSEGGLRGEVLSVWTGGRLPAGVNRLLEQQEFTRIVGKSQERTSRALILSGLQVPWGERVEIQFPNTAIYPPTNYVPQAVGIALARTAGGGPLVAMYAGRLTNLLFFLAVTWVAIRRMPYAATGLAVVALMPITLFQAATLSCDTPLNALSFLLLALSLLPLDGADGRIDRRRWGIRLLVGALVAAGKSVYAPLLAVGFVRAVATARERRVKALAAEALIIVVGLAVTAAWYANNTEHMISVRSHLAHIDSHAQFAAVLGAPLDYLRIMGETMVAQWYIYVLTTMGVLGWLDTLLPLSFYTVLPWVLLFFLLARNPDDAVPPVVLRVGLVALVAACLFAIYLSLYLSWTEVGARMVEGVSGRYFIPLLVPLMIALAVPVVPFRLAAVPQRLLLAAVALFMANGTLHAVLGRYY